MTSGKKEFKQRTVVSGYVEKEELDAFQDIRWRERDSESEAVRKAIKEYIKNHGSGNSTFKLDMWRDNPDFQAVPTILSRSEIWFKYLESCSPEERLRIQIQSNKINQQCKGISQGTARSRT